MVEIFGVLRCVLYESAPSPYRRSLGMDPSNHIARFITNL
jgi:hypothetical protein